ncbi:hypothetical protein V6N13_121378 [Hibiscus sabdariffa]|uniref:S-protein homolog n=1 Tax=Hibiscus sabdariffa TaxID=183260 RepID=A0ABR2PDW3_9ROSI
MYICYNPLTIAFLCMVLLASSISAATQASPPESEDRVFFRTRYKVHILNGMPDNVNPVTIACRSKDDDLGTHTLTQGREFEFEFHIILFMRTHFSCYFWWRDQHANDITVFDDRLEGRDCRQKGNCFWKAAPEGIYFSPDYQYWDLRYNWTGPHRN